MAGGATRRAYTENTENSDPASVRGGYFGIFLKTHRFKNAKNLIEVYLSPLKRARHETRLVRHYFEAPRVFVGLWLCKISSIHGWGRYQARIPKIPTPRVLEVFREC